MSDLNVSQLERALGRQLSGAELDLARESAIPYDDDGVPIVRVSTCGTCDRSWNDAAISGTTPAPSGRCPFEYEHDEHEPVSDWLRARPPLTRLGAWLATNVGLGDEPTHEEVTRVIDALGGSSVPDSVGDVGAALGLSDDA